MRYPKKRREALAKLKIYFMKNQNRILYANCRNLILPSGSDCVESAIRRVINLKLKSPTRRFLETGDGRVDVVSKKTAFIRQMEHHDRQSFLHVRALCLSY
jgi:hypothetical protein